MPKPLSLDLRQRISDASALYSASVTAERLNVSTATVHRLRALLRKTGSLEPKPHGGGQQRLLTDEDRPRFEAYLAEDVSMTQDEMAARFEAETGRIVSRPTVNRQIGRWDLTRKKS